MTVTRSGFEFTFGNRRIDRKHSSRAPAKPNRRRTKKTTRKARSNKVDLTALTRRIIYRQRARANELATGDGPDALRQKRRWIQEMSESGRISGKATRELHDLYSKRNMGKPQLQLEMTQRLTEAAISAKQQLDEHFRGNPSANSPADTVDVSNSDNLGDAAPGEPSNAAYSTTEANDAAARQWCIDNGYELADYSTVDGVTGANEGDAQGAEEDEVQIKVEEDAEG